MAGKKKQEAIEVEAEVMEGGLSVLSKADAWLASAAERVAEKAAQHRPPESIGNEKARKDAMRARADCRKDAAEIDAERKAMLRDAEDALKRFKAGVKDVLSPLTELDETYKRLLDEYEDRWRDDRKIELAREYSEIAPDLVPLVPFDRLLERYGAEKGSSWLMRSTNVESAKDMMADAVAKIADGERIISEMADPEDAEGIKARYFETLDLQATLAEARRLREQRERVRILEQQRREREEQARIAAEEAVRAEQEREQMPAPMPAPEPEPTPAPEPAPEPEPAPAPMPAPMPEPAPAPMPAPMPEPAPMQMPEPEQEAPHAWVISVPNATRDEMQAVADFMRARGIRFDRIYSGGIADVYAKEAGNGR